MANGTGFGPVRVVQKCRRFDVASAAFGSLSIWRNFFYTHLKDSVVSKGGLHSVAFGTYYGRTGDH